MQKWKDYIKRLYRNMPDKKIYLEFITAALTVPVLITVLLNNINSLKKEPLPLVTPTVAPMLSLPPKATPKKQAPPPDPGDTSSPDSSPTSTCTALVGELSITSPDEQEQVTRDPVCLEIARKTSGYCPIVWSYRINNSAWSDYTDKSICLYGLPSGDKHVDVRTRSIVSSDETLIQRSFTVVGPTPTPSPVPVSTNSGTLK